MIHDILNSTSIERLKVILRDRYGKSLEVSFLNDSGLADPEGASSVREGSLKIPIWSEGRFLALASISEITSVPESSREAITEVVKLILEPTLHRWFRQQTDVNNNVLMPFQRVGNIHLVQDQVFETKESHDLSPVVLITSTNPNRIHRIATLAHEMIGRWAFVGWRDICPQIKSVQDISEMGAMTLFIEDVLTLTEFEKELLSEWALVSNEATDPALILGSTMPWHQLLEQNILPVSLLHHASRMQIHADRLPTDRKLCEEAIKLLLDKEVGFHNH